MRQATEEIGQKLVLALDKTGFLNGLLAIFGVRHSHSQSVEMVIVKRHIHLEFIPFKFEGRGFHRL